MRVLMSIKPNFVQQIAMGNKKFEFRRVLFKRSDIDSIVVYASSPISKIVGEISFDKVLSDQPEQIWLETNKEAGISKSYFDDYFSGKNIAHAISITKFKKYDQPINLETLNVERAPQSFCYIR